MATHPPATKLRSGRDYPPSYAELRAWFPDDAACLDFLDWLRWPDGFACPVCGHIGGWRLADGTYWCEPCRRRVSVTAGTIFHRTRTPLTVWFAAAWFMTSSKNGVSAKTLHNLLGFGSYQTAWAMLHRYRSAMVRPGRSRLSGLVEVDETYIGGTKAGKRGRGAAGKALVLVAVELRTPVGFGRCRLRVVPDFQAHTIEQFLGEMIVPGSALITDGLSSYPKAIGDRYVHKSHLVGTNKAKAHEALPAVHRVASLVKRWLLGTHQGGVSADHLQSYLDEFEFRFNRRKSGYRGLLFRRLLEQAVEMPPVTYQSLVANPAPKGKVPVPPRTKDRRSGPASLEASPLHRRPWREP